MNPGYVYTTILVLIAYLTLIFASSSLAPSVSVSCLCWESLLGWLHIWMEGSDEH